MQNLKIAILFRSSLLCVVQNCEIFHMISSQVTPFLLSNGFSRLSEILHQLFAPHNASEILRQNLYVIFFEFLGTNIDWPFEKNLEILSADSLNVPLSNNYLKSIEFLFFVTQL